MLAGGAFLRRMFRNGVWRCFRDGMPFDPESLIGPNSLDMPLGAHFLRMVPPDHDGALDLQDPAAAVKWVAEVASAEHPFILAPGDFALGCTIVRVECDAATPYGTFAPSYEGRSTLARLGLGSHVTAGFGDYGFAGTWTLELTNHGTHKLALTPGLRIGQLYFQQVVDPLRYQGAYTDQQEARPRPPELGPGRF